MNGKASQDDLYRDAADKYGSALERLARAYEADPEKRRDLVQEIHFQLWRSFQRFDARCSLRTWIYRVAHYVASSHVLRERRIFSNLVSLEELELLPDKDHGPVAADRHMNLERLSMLIHQLKPLDRQVIVSYLEGMDSAADWRNHGAFVRKCGHADTPDQEHPGAAVSRRRQPCRLILPE